MARRTDQQTVSSEFASVPVVRQPIVDREKDLFAYDLRFPADAEVISVDGDPEQAWAWLSGGGGADASDLLALAGDTKAFLQITPALLLSAAYAALPRGSAIVAKDCGFVGVSRAGGDPGAEAPVLPAPRRP